MRVVNHYFVQELHWRFKVGSKPRLQCYRLDCHLMVILIIMTLLDERYFVNQNICNHSIFQSYPPIADCHYWEEAGLLEFKWFAEIFIAWDASTFVGNLSNRLSVGVRFCKMKNSQIHWLHCTPCWFLAGFEDGFPNTHSQPRLVAGLIMAAWNSFKGGNVSLATGKKAPGQGSRFYSTSIFKNIPRKAFSLPVIF